MDIYDKLNARIDEIGFGFPRSYIKADKRLMKQILQRRIARTFWQWTRAIRQLRNMLQRMA